MVKVIELETNLVDKLEKELRTFFNMKRCLMHMIDRNLTLATMFQSTCILQVHLCFTLINFVV